MPVRSFISVDLPAPFSPTRPSTSPARTSRCMSSSALTPGKLLLTPRTSSSSDGSGGLARVSSSISLPYWNHSVRPQKPLGHELAPRVGGDRLVEERGVAPDLDSRPGPQAHRRHRRVSQGE